MYKMEAAQQGETVLKVVLTQETMTKGKGLNPLTLTSAGSIEESVMKLDAPVPLFTVLSVDFLIRVLERILSGLLCVGTKCMCCCCCVWCSNF